MTTLVTFEVFTRKIVSCIKLDLETDGSFVQTTATGLCGKGISFDIYTGVEPVIIEIDDILYLKENSCIINKL